MTRHLPQDIQNDFVKIGTDYAVLIKELSKRDQLYLVYFFKTWRFIFSDFDSVRTAHIFLIYNEIKTTSLNSVATSPKNKHSHKKFNA